MVFQKSGGVWRLTARQTQAQLASKTIERSNEESLTVGSHSGNEGRKAESPCAQMNAAQGLS